jgi:hypothetical protein
MAAFFLRDPLDYNTITNVYLYGSLTTPSNIFDRIRSPTSGADTVEIDTQALLQGPVIRHAESRLLKLAARPEFQGGRDGAGQIGLAG